jgi:pyrroloquinoline-quinone synthase
VTSSFAESLHERIREGRSFGGHPLWHAIEQGRVSRHGLAIFAVQFFLQVREFPRAVSALHSHCPYPDERVELAESLYEEETGRISGCNVSHPELFMRFGVALGLQREEMLDGKPLPETAALIDWFERSTRDLSFIEGAAATNLAAEGQVPGAFGPFARALQERYGLDRHAVSFWDVHEIADREHSDVGSHIVVRFANSDSMREKVLVAVDRSLERWRGFFDGMQREIESRE